MDVQAHNRAAWNRQVERENRWTRPVTAEEIEAARQGDWSIVLTWEQPVPRDWSPSATTSIWRWWKVTIAADRGGGGQPAVRPHVRRPDRGTAGGGVRAD